MDFEFQGKYKSLENIIWNNIPKISVITGRNGAGKSQLLELIKIAITHNWDNYPIPEEAPKKLPIITKDNFGREDLVFLRGEWVLKNLSSVNLTHLQNERESHFEKFKQRLTDISIELQQLEIDPSIS